MVEEILHMKLRAHGPIMSYKLGLFAGSITLLSNLSSKRLLLGHSGGKKHN
jgi:hypothetical protein